MYDSTCTHTHTQTNAYVMYYTVHCNFSPNAGDTYICWFRGWTFCEMVDVCPFYKVAGLLTLNWSKSMLVAISRNYSGQRWMFEFVWIHKRSMIHIYRYMLVRQSKVKQSIVMLPNSITSNADRNYIRIAMFIEYWRLKDKSAAMIIIIISKLNGQIETIFK